MGLKYVRKKNKTTYSVKVNNVGTISDPWTLTFTADNTGSIGTRPTSSNFTPINVNAGGGSYYFVLRSSGWGGTWTIG